VEPSKVLVAIPGSLPAIMARIGLLSTGVSRHRSLQQVLGSLVGHSCLSHSLQSHFADGDQSVHDQRVIFARLRKAGYDNEGA
jgi:hypothetical protein